MAVYGILISEFFSPHCTAFSYIYTSNPTHTPITEEEISRMSEKSFEHSAYAASKVSELGELPSSLICRHSYSAVSGCIPTYVGPLTCKCLCGLVCFECGVSSNLL